MQRYLLTIFSIGMLSLHSSAQELARVLKDICSNYDIMGATLVVFNKKGIIENISTGQSDFERKIPTTTDTKYRVASVSKTITAIAIMQLVEQKKLDLDADVSPLLQTTIQNPFYPGSAITTRMLLSHTSGILDSDSYDLFLEATLHQEVMPHLSELLNPTGKYYTTGQFNPAPPGRYFTYSNLNYVILGTLVEKISGLRFDVYCKEYIINPLGIDASFNVNDLHNLNQLAVLYRKMNGIWIPQVDNFQGKQPIFSNLDNYTPGTNGARFGPQGGFRCSAQDLAKIFLHLMNKGTYGTTKLLSAESCKAMFADEWTFHGNNGNNYSGLFRSWGLGIHRITSTPLNDIVWSGSNIMLGHSGEAYGLISNVYFDKKKKTGFAFITNGSGIGYQKNEHAAFYTIEQEIFRAVEKYGYINH